MEITYQSTLEGVTLPEYQGLALGSTLLTKLLDDLRGFSSIDGTCDDELADYYERFGFLRATA